MENDFIQMLRLSVEVISAVESFESKMKNEFNPDMRQRLDDWSNYTSESYQSLKKGTIELSEKTDAYIAFMKEIIKKASPCHVGNGGGGYDKLDFCEKTGLIHKIEISILKGLLMKRKFKETFDHCREMYVCMKELVLTKDQNDLFVDNIVKTIDSTIADLDLTPLPEDERDPIEKEYEELMKKAEFEGSFDDFVKCL